MAKRGTPKATERLRKCTPPKRAIAATGVTFHGCGIIRATVAMPIIPTNVQKRGFIMTFPLVPRPDKQKVFEQPVHQALYLFYLEKWARQKQMCDILHFLRRGLPLP